MVLTASKQFSLNINEFQTFDYLSLLLYAYHIPDEDIKISVAILLIAGKKRI